MPIFEVIGEAIVEWVFEPIVNIVFAIPGAFIRFVISRLWRSKRSLSDFMKDDVMMNGVVGLIFFVLIGVLLVNAR